MSVCNSAHFQACGTKWQIWDHGVSICGKTHENDCRHLDEGVVGATCAAIAAVRVGAGGCRRGNSLPADEWLEPILAKLPPKPVNVTDGFQSLSNEGPELPQTTSSRFFSRSSYHVPITSPAPTGIATSLHPSISTHAFRANSEAL